MNQQLKSFLLIGAAIAVLAIGAWGSADVGESVVANGNHIVAHALANGTDAPTQTLDGGGDGFGCSDCGGGNGVGDGFGGGLVGGDGFGCSDCGSGGGGGGFFGGGGGGGVGGGGGGGGGGPSIPVHVPALCTLTATPTNLSGPGNVRLDWSASGAVSGSIDNGGGTLSGLDGGADSGNVTVPVSQTTIFTATFHGQGSSVGPTPENAVVSPYGMYAVAAGDTFSLTFSNLGGGASKNSAYGYYLADASGNPISGAIIWRNVRDKNDLSASVSLSAAQLSGAAAIGFFMVPDASNSHLNHNPGLSDGDAITFSQSGGGWKAFKGGVMLIGDYNNIVYFTNPTLNTDGTNHMIDKGDKGNQNWEDQLGGGDLSYDDFNLQVNASVTPAGGGINTPGPIVNCTATVTVTPPVDVCPNIAGNQSSVPAGLIVDSAGNCVPPPGNGCVQVLKETFDTSGNKLSPVAQFSFKLDGGAPIQNDANGNAAFNNVTPGTHQVTEVPMSGWTLLSATPANGTVVVTAGPICSAVVFKNQQVPPTPGNGCIVVTKQTLDTNGANLTPVAQFTFKLDGGATVQNDANGNAVFNNVTPGVHQVTEVPAGANWNLMSVVPASGNVTVQSGPTCAPVAFVNKQVVPPVTNHPACTLTAAPNSFGVGGGNTTLSWTTTNVASASIDHGIAASISLPLLAAGSVSPISVTTSTTYTLTAIGTDGSTVTCSAPVTVATPPGPACTLSISSSVIHTGDSVKVSWTSSNVTSGSIDNNVGAATPVASGTSVDIFPPSSTTFTGTFTGPNGNVTCTIPVTVVPRGGGCGNACPGGLDQPNVALFKQANNQPLAFVSLAQIPYTGFEAGPALTMIFWLAVALLSALIAYGIVGQGGMRSLLAYALTGLVGMPVQKRDEYTYGADYPSFDDHTHFSAPAAAPVQPVMVAPAPAPTPVQHARVETALPDIAAVIESRAHAAGVLMSPEAVMLAVALSPNRADALQMFGNVLNEAVRTVPREDGWIMLTADRMRTLAQGRSAAPVPAPIHVVESFPAASADDSAASAFAGAVLSGDRDSAFSIIRSLEHDGVSPTALVTGTASAFDKLYRARKDNRVAPDTALADKGSHIADDKLEKLVGVFTHALDHVYASPFTGVKLALAQAFEALA